MYINNLSSDEAGFILPSAPNAQIIKYGNVSFTNLN
jgi:hypothetical protein